MLAVELHSHSVRSHDGRDPVGQLLERAQTVGLDALAVTDHDAIEASLEAAELAPEYDIVGIPGIEISTAAGHVLGIGVEEVIERDLPFQETIDRIHDAGGIAVVPHPFQELRKGVLRSVSKQDLVAADAIEVYNSRLLTGISNRQAEKLAARYGIPMTAGSDAHVAEMVGQAVTLADTDDRSVEGVLNAIREGKTSIDGRRTPFETTLRQAFGTAKRRARRTLFE